MGYSPPPLITAPRVSVLLPVYNGEKTIAAAVTSILRQSFSDFELIVINDGSTDHTVDVLRDIQDPRIRMITHTSSTSLAASLNEGIDAARGLYIARMDADDLSFPHRLEKQAAFLDMHPDIDLLGCRALAFYDGGILIGTLPFAPAHEGICARPWRKFLLPHPTWMGRTVWFNKFRYASPEIKRAEDQDLLLRSFRSSRFACLDDVLLAYRQGPYNMIKTLTARWHLMRAQMHSFAQNHEWKNAFLAVVMASLKSVVDIVAAIPGCNRLFFVRMEGNVPLDARHTFNQILRNL